MNPDSLTYGPVLHGSHVGVVKGEVGPIETGERGPTDSETLSEGTCLWTCSYLLEGTRRTKEKRRKLRFWLWCYGCGFLVDLWCQDFVGKGGFEIVKLKPNKILI